MDEWDGDRIRALFQNNVPGTLDVMVQTHWNQQPEVQMLVLRIRDLVLASQNPRDQAALRDPLIGLLNVMATHAPVFVIHPYNYHVYLMGRSFAVTAMIVVDLNEPTFELANEESRLTRMSAKRKLVFNKEETVTSPKRKQLILEEEDSPILNVPKRRSSRVKSDVAAVDYSYPDYSFLDESVAESPLVRPVAAKVEVVDDNGMEDNGVGLPDGAEGKKCDHCKLVVAVSDTEQMKHMWKKHRNLVYKHIRPELVCSIDYCDYVSSSVQARKIHEGKTHGTESPAQSSVVSELKDSKCNYCAADIDGIVGLKQHLLQCTQRDERPMIGCSSCPNKSFHFIYDYTLHLKKCGGVTHGHPTLPPLSNK